MTFFAISWFHRCSLIKSTTVHHECIVRVCGARKSVCEVCYCFFFSITLTLNQIAHAHTYERPSWRVDIVKCMATAKIAACLLCFLSEPVFMAYCCLFAALYDFLFSSSNCAMRTAALNPFSIYSLYRADLNKHILNELKSSFRKRC